MLAACSGAFVGPTLGDGGSAQVDATVVDALGDGNRAGQEPADASPGDARDGATSCGVGTPFHTVREVEHADASDEPDILADAGAAELVPVPGRAEAWVVLDLGAFVDAGQQHLLRVRGTITSRGDGGVRYVGGANVPPFEAGAYDGLTFDPRGNAVVGLDGSIVHSASDGGVYAPPRRVTLPPPITALPGAPFVTADGRWLFFTQDSRLFLSDLTGGTLDAPPAPREVGLSFGTKRIVATPSLESAYWVNSRGDLVGGRLRDGDIVQETARLAELDVAGNDAKYPTWLSEDGCLMFFVRVVDGGSKVLWYARKG